MFLDPLYVVDLLEAEVLPKKLVVSFSSKDRRKLA